jgi:hypothetical protein
MLLRAVVLIYFILLNVRSIIVDDTGIVNAPTIRDITVGNACLNGKTSKYNSTIFYDFDCSNMDEHVEICSSCCSSLVDVELISTISCERESVVLCGIAKVELRFFTLHELKKDRIVPRFGSFEDLSIFKL